MRALIADDHELFRSGMKQLLVDMLQADDVREAETLDQAIDILTNEGAGDLILIDWRMPGMSGAEALAALRDGFPEAKLAVVSAWEERAAVLGARCAIHFGEDVARFGALHPPLQRAEIGGSKNRLSAAHAAGATRRAMHFQMLRGV